MENKKIFINRKMSHDTFHMAPVEIIVPFFGEQARVTRLIESIFRTVHTNRYLITLVDDASENKSFIKQIDKKKIPGVRCFQKEKQEGFGAAVNMALKQPFQRPTDPNFQIPLVVIMHSDVFVEDNNWLSNLGYSLSSLREDGVRMVSPMTNNPSADYPFLVGSKGEKRDDHILADGYLPMYCVLAHRELFNRVGLLDEHPYASIEAQEYADRMAGMGFKQAVCGSSWVNHHGGATVAKLANNRKAQEILRKVREEYDMKSKKEVGSGT